MTLYNKAAFVREAVQSVLRNSFTDLELLIVDDASIDGGVDLVRGLDDTRIRIIPWPHANSGRAAAANRGFDAARGMYVAVLDADDLAEPERFARQVAFLDAHPEVGAVGSAARAFGRRSLVVAWPASDQEARSDMVFADPMLYGAAMFRRSVLLASGIRCREDWLLPGMDYLFLLELARHTRFANLPEMLTQYRIGPNNFLHGRDVLADRVATFTEAFRILGIPAGPEEARLHVLFEKRVTSSPGARTIRELHAWMERLRDWNKHGKHLPHPAFELRLLHRWTELFYVLADRWPLAALEHQRISGQWSFRRMAYLLRARWAMPRPR